MRSQLDNLSELAQSAGSHSYTEKCGTLGRLQKVRPRTNRQDYLTKRLSRLRYARGHNVYDEAKKIIDNKIPVLMYYGDTDAVVSFLNGQKFLAAIGLKVRNPG